MSLLRRELAESFGGVDTDYSPSQLLGVEIHSAPDYLMY